MSAPGTIGTVSLTAVVILSMAVVARPAPLPSVSSGGRIVVDDRGKPVSVPTDLKRAAVLFPPSVDDYLVATDRPRTLAAAQSFNRVPLKSGVLGRVFPAARAATILPGGPATATSVEAMLRIGVEVAFVNRGTAPRLERVGLPALAIDNPGTLHYAVNTARVFTAATGEDARLDELKRGYRRNMAALADVRAALPPAPPRRVASLYVFQGRMTGSGASDPQATLIALAGGRNALGGGAQVHLDRERLLLADPDLIVVMTTASPQSAPATILADPALASLKAVRARRVYRAMSGLEFFPMGLVGYPLYARWLAELIRPDLPPDLRRQVRIAYQGATGHRLSDADLDAALAIAENRGQANYARFAQ